MPIPDHLLAAEFVNLATYRKNGDAVATPIWAAPLDGKLYAFSEAKAGKMKRLKNFSRAQIAPCNRTGKLLGVWQDAKAFIVEDPAEIEAANQALLAKYGWKFTVTSMASKLVGRYNKRGYLRIEMP
jgi:PPOX class probable F420-dependent enzyme